MNGKEPKKPFCRSHERTEKINFAGVLGSWGGSRSLRKLFFWSFAEKTKKWTIYREDPKKIQEPWRVGGRGAPGVSENCFYWSFAEKNQKKKLYIERTKKNKTNKNKISRSLGGLEGGGSRSLRKYFLSFFVFWSSAEKTKKHPGVVGGWGGSRSLRKLFFCFFGSLERKPKDNFPGVLGGWGGSRSLRKLFFLSSADVCFLHCILCFCFM